MKRQPKKRAPSLNSGKRVVGYGKELSYPLSLNRFGDKEFRGGTLYPAPDVERPHAPTHPQLSYPQKLNRFGDKAFRGGKTSERKGGGDA